MRPTNSTLIWDYRDSPERWAMMLDAAKRARFFLRSRPDTCPFCAQHVFTCSQCPAHRTNYRWAANGRTPADHYQCWQLGKILLMHEDIGDSEMNRELMDKITGGGLWSVVSEEPFFSWQGCDYCRARTGKALGNIVYDCKGYESLEGAQAHDPADPFYSFRLCSDCICAVANGEPWPEEMGELLEDDPIEPPGKVFAEEEADDDSWRYSFRAILGAVPE